MRFNNACGFDSGPQNILLRGDVPRRWYAIKGIQVTERKKPRTNLVSRVITGKPNIGWSEMKDKTTTSPTPSPLCLNNIYSYLS